MATKEQLQSALDAYQRAHAALKNVCDVYAAEPALQREPPFAITFCEEFNDTLQKLSMVKIMYEVMLRHYEETQNMTTLQKGEFHIRTAMQRMGLSMRDAE